MAGVHLPHDGEGRDDAVMHAREDSAFLLMRGGCSERTLGSSLPSEMPWFASRVVHVSGAGVQRCSFTPGLG